MSKATRIPVRAQNAPAPAPFLSQAIVVGDMVYCSGQLGVNPTTNQMVEGSIKERTKQIMLNLSAVLEAGGSSLRDAVKMNIYLANMDDFGAVNEVYDSFFEGARPARTCVAVKTLPKGSDVEIECTGVVTGLPKGASRL